MIETISVSTKTHMSIVKRIVEMTKTDALLTKTILSYPKLLELRRSRFSFLSMLVPNIFRIKKLIP
jgi:hypothetical protein